MNNDFYILVFSIHKEVISILYNEIEEEYCFVYRQLPNRAWVKIKIDVNVKIYKNHYLFISSFKEFLTFFSLLTWRFSYSIVLVSKLAIY
jgi:hypothetical protein